MIYNVLTYKDIEITAQLASEIWNEHYASIIGQNQVNYMLKKFQSIDAITSQIKNGHEYFLLSINNEAIGYLCLISDKTLKKLMISKLYVIKEKRAFGFGNQLLDFAKKVAKDKEFGTIWLTVNKYNSNSVKWYEKNHFKIVDEIKMDIGNNFIMDDFVMELQLD